MRDLEDSRCLRLSAEGGVNSHVVVVSVDRFGGLGEVFTFAFFSGTRLLYPSGCWSGRVSKHQTSRIGGNEKKSVEKGVTGLLQDG